MWVYSPLFVTLCLAAGVLTLARPTNPLSPVLGLLWIVLGGWYARRAYAFHRARLQAQRRGEPPPTLR